MLHVQPCPCPCCMSMLHVHLHATCLCPCCKSMAILHGCVHACMSVSMPACLCLFCMSVSMLHVPAMHVRVHVHAAGPGLMLDLYANVHVHAHVARSSPCPFYMSIPVLHVHVHAACTCPCCTSRPWPTFKPVPILDYPNIGIIWHPIRKICLSNIFLLFSCLCSCSYSVFVFAFMFKSMFAFTDIHRFGSQIPDICRGRHLKHYSGILKMQRYNFALPYNALKNKLSRIVIASKSYRSEPIGPVIASYSYHSDLTHQRYCIYSLLLLGKIAFRRKYIIILFWFSQKKYTRKIIGKAFADVWKRKCLFQ